jgi:hypothetical protein
MKCEEDKKFLIDAYAKWWKIPNEQDIEYFCERVSIIVMDDEIDIESARKITFEKMIYK